MKDVGNERNNLIYFHMKMMKKSSFTTWTFFFFYLCFVNIVEQRLF